MPAIEKLTLNPFSSKMMEPLDEMSRITGHGSAVIDNKLYLIGGWLKDIGSPTNRVIVFDLETQSCSSAASMNVKRYRY